MDKAHVTAVLGAWSYVHKLYMTASKYQPASGLYFIAIARDRKMYMGVVEELRSSLSEIGCALHLEGDCEALIIHVYEVVTDA
jgi:hypothetical protein